MLKRMRLLDRPILLSPGAERFALYALTLWYMASFAWMAHDTITTICGALHIRAFTIPHGSVRTE